jgi:outer membrane protein
MRNTIKLLIVTFLLFVSLAGYSQQKPLKFGHINTEDVLTSMSERDSAAAQLEKFGKGLQDQLEGMKVEVNKKIEIYLKEKATAGDLVNKTREEEISQMQQRIQQFQNSAQEEYQSKQQELMQPVLDKLQKAISDVGKENGFIYIFIKNDNVIPFMSSESEDVTLKVKQKLGIKDKPKTQQK